MRGMQAARPAQRADRSIRIVAKDEMVMPSDIGLLEGTAMLFSIKTQTYH